MLEKLPIDEIKEEFTRALAEEQTILLTAEPGAGKSTRLPLWLLDKSVGIPGKIYLLQPRRVAVKSIASYLAQQLDEPVGKTVGYRVRNDSKVTSNTRLEVITEGILVQLMQNDPELDGTSLIILDEFHERSLHADLAFAIARDIQQGLRDDLTLLLMSATLASDALKKALPDAHCLSSKGRSYPVTVEYKPVKNIRLWREHALSVIKQAIVVNQGSILVFLPGSGDIRYIKEQLEHENFDSLNVCALYGDLSISEQQQAILPCSRGYRKIVLATNIAETSLTIEGIQLVIDSGLEKVAVYDDNTLTNKLIQRNVAKSSAIQRMGRAGRLAKGHCIRLFSEEEFHRRPLQNNLPIQQADILPVVVEAARWGVSQLVDLPLLDLPNKQTEQNAWEIIKKLEVVGDHGSLTPHGEQTSSLNCHARFAHMVIKSSELEKKHACVGLTYLACILASLLEEKDILKKERSADDCDVRTRISFLITQPKVYLHQQILKQAKSLIHKVNGKPSQALPLEYIGVLLYLAFPERLSKRRSSHGEYIASYGKGLTVNENDALSNSRYIIAVHLMTYRHKLIVKLASSIDIEQLFEWQLIEPNMEEKLDYDSATGRISSVSQQSIGAVVIAEKKSKQPPSGAQVFAIWKEQIQKAGLYFLKWNEQDQSLLLRWRWLNRTQSQLGFPDVSENGLLSQLDVWLQPFVSDITSKTLLHKLDLSEILLALLDYQQQKIFRCSAPSYFIGPTGRKCPIRYSDEHPPIVSLPMQEVYGLKSNPTVGDGKSEINLTLEFLSPAKRPIQTTADLAGFWAGSYKAVQKDMKSQYPKHFWPDDPANAVATNKTKRHMKN